MGETAEPTRWAPVSCSFFQGIDGKRRLKRLTPAERIRLITTVAAIGAFLAWVWLATPLRDYVNVAQLAAAAHSLEDVPFAPLLVMAVYVVGTLFLVPITLLVAVTGLVFGAWPGLAYAFGGSMASAVVIYGLGACVGNAWLKRLFGSRVDALNKRVAKRGIRAVLVMRLVPVAPFAVVSVVGGASHISLRDYVVGTALGMAPGIVLKVVFTDQLARAAESSNLVLLRQLGLIALALVLIGVGIRWYVGKRTSAAPDEKSDASEEPERAAAREV